MTLRPSMPDPKKYAKTLASNCKIESKAGFTLLELMVAMALTSLLVVVVYASLNLSLKARERSQATSELLQELRMGQRILTRSLSSAVPGTMGTRLYFQGDSNQMRFFTSTPLEAHSLGGIYHWRVLMGRDDAGKGVLAVEQTRNINWRRDPEGVEVRQIIMNNLSSLQFSYGITQDSQMNWDARTEGRLPDWVKVDLTIMGREPIVLLIPIHMAKTGADQKSRQTEKPFRQ